MPIYLTNTLTGQKEEFKPLVGHKVKIYTCGMTVQDSPHLGHLRTFIFADVLRRFLEYSGYEVFYLQNFTDIDDKILQKAKEEKLDYRVITQQKIEEYMEVSRRMNIKKADVYPHATKHIQEMIELIERLLKKEFAYISGQDVYFDVTKFFGYGKLSKKRLEDLIAGARVEIEEKKRSPLDFVLWKGHKEGEPYWYAPFGKGRPGWHIECSAMAMHYLGETFDIHIGGEDLIFPHHENEIAQSEAATGKPFVKYWLHNGLLLLRGEKMAKSTRNYFLAKEALKDYHPNVIRLFLLKAHYRSPYEFAIERLEEAKKQWLRLEEFLYLSERMVPSFNFKPQEEFIKAMSDDLNTPQALGEIFKLVEERFKYQNISKEENERIYSLVRSSLELLGFKTERKERISQVLEISAPVGLKAEIEKFSIQPEALIEARRIARENSRYDIADKIRIALEKLGYELRDTKEGTVTILRSDLEENSELFSQLIGELRAELRKEDKKEAYLSQILKLLEYETY